METFEYYIDKKFTIWARERYYVKASSKHEADNIMQETFKHGDTYGFSDDFEYIYETSEQLDPEDNGGESTMELFEGNGNLIVTNKIIQMTIYHFDDWVNYMLSNSDYSEMELMEFEEHYQNLLDFETNINNFIKIKTN